MALAQRIFDAFCSTCVGPLASRPGHKMKQARPRRHDSRPCGFELLEHRDLLSAVTLVCEGFEKGALAKSGWCAQDANPVGVAAYWRDIGKAFGGEGVHGGLCKGYCAGSGYAGTGSNPYYRNCMDSCMSKSVDLSGMTSASLSFWYKMPSVQWGRYDHLKVYVDSTKILDISTAVTSWTKKAVNLTPYVGGTHTLKFEFTSNGTGVAEGSYLDDIAVIGCGPCNDSFSNYTRICGYTASVSGTNLGATKESGEPNHAGNSGGKSVWWKWVAPVDCDVQIDTVGSSFDTLLGVYTGSSVSTLTTVASDDNSGGSGASKVTFSATAGTYYRIAVDGFNGAAGSVKLNLSATLTDEYEPDDTEETASTIGIDGAVQVHNIGTTSDVDWVTFTVDQTSPVVIETRGDGCGNIQMSLYGPDSPTTELASSDSKLSYGNSSGLGCSSSSRIVSADLAEGTYRLKIDGDGSIVPEYRLSVTALQEADVFLTRSDCDLLSTAIRLAEVTALDVAYANTYSHAAMYVGNGLVAEMLGTGYKETALVTWFNEHDYVDIYRNNGLGDLADDVAAAARVYTGTPYAYYEIEVLGLKALSTDPERDMPILWNQAYTSYEAHDFGTQRMICSELVARAFADVGGTATLDVTIWPSMDAIGDTSPDFHWDFTTPTCLSLSSSLTRLNV
jgi:uncharacterized protein YycO